MPIVREAAFCVQEIGLKFLLFFRAATGFANIFCASMWSISKWKWAGNSKYLISGVADILLACASWYVTVKIF
jgi:hypothetical protein